MQKASRPQRRVFRDKYLAAFTAAVLLICSNGRAQVYQKNTGYGTEFRGIVPDSVLYFPTGCGAPSGLASLNSYGFGNGEKKRMAAIFADTCGHYVYWLDWSDTTWKQMGSGSGSVDSALYVTITRLADSSAALRSLISSGFDSSTSQGGGFHTQPYNDVRYLKKSDSAGAGGYVTHAQEDTAKNNLRAEIAAGGGGGGTTDLPTAISQHTIFSDDDSVNLGAHKLKFQNGFLQADKFRFGFTDSARTKGAMYIGDSVIMSFYDPNQPGKNIFFGMGSGPTFGAITPGGDNGSLLIAIGTNSYNPCTTCHENTSVGNQNMQYCTTCLGNAMFGETAGRLITTGADNTAVGVHALNSQTTANNNTAVGKRALETTTTGNDNTGIGWQVMDKNTTGNSNTAAGHSALENNTTGADNVAVGKQALDANTTGSYNIAIGRHSMAYNTNGIENVAVGEEAGSITNAVHDNTGVYLGFQASRDASVGSGTTLNNTIAIGYNAESDLLRMRGIGWYRNGFYQRCDWH